MERFGATTKKKKTRTTQHIYLNEGVYLCCPLTSRYLPKNATEVTYSEHCNKISHKKKFSFHVQKRSVAKQIIATFKKKVMLQ